MYCDMTHCILVFDLTRTTDTMMNRYYDEY